MDMENKTINKDTDKFPCPGCGGNMHFDPGSGMLKCEYCDSTVNFERADGEIQEYDFFALTEEESDSHVATDEWSEAAFEIQCESCGAKTVITDDTLSKFCAFCGSSHIIKQEDVTGIAPESVIPFSITAKQAKSIYSKWIKKRWLAPKALKNQSIAGKYRGMYIPYWTYDSDAHYAYTAQAGDYYYVTQTRKDSNGKTVTEQVRKIRWRTVRGSGRKYFDDVQVPATSKLDLSLLPRLEPFTLGKLLPYQPEFLSGFLAERYSVDVKDGWENAKEEIKDDLRSVVRNSIVADEVRNIVLTVSHNEVKYKHLLVPVWLSSYKYKDKKYQVMINGENGKIIGKSPISPWKIAAIVLGIAAFAAIIYFIVQAQG